MIFVQQWLPHASVIHGYNTIAQVSAAAAEACSTSCCGSMQVHLLAPAVVAAPPASQMCESPRQVRPGLPVTDGRHDVHDVAHSGN